jgi:RimJ/RimL family protein N-acetyltransferase
MHRDVVDMLEGDTAPVVRNRDARSPSVEVPCADVASGPEGAMNLQRLSAADADMILAMEADPEVMLHSTGLIAPTEARRNELILYLASDQRGFGHCAISLSGVTVGWVSLIPLANTQRIQATYRLTREYWGRGLATQAVHDICFYAKHGVGAATAAVAKYARSRQ